MMKLTELENWLAENGVYHGSNVTFSVDALLEALTGPEDDDYELDDLLDDEHDLECRDYGLQQDGKK